jgi:hypothetical protein
MDDKFFSYYQYNLGFRHIESCDELNQELDQLLYMNFIFDNDSQNLFNFHTIISNKLCF